VAVKPSVAKTLKRGDPLWVRGHVREVDASGKWIEVQFSTPYSIDITVKDIRRPRKKKS
jgi:hypothetical protein